MQHPDEGTIHSWLDGALSADEAARVEAHVKDCPECAAAVAEARGFIAASSRILTALDNAPRGVIPATAPKKRFDPMMWRIAATAMVVAVGTLAVVRSRGGDERPMSISADRAPLPPHSTSEERGPAATAQPEIGPTTTAPTATARVATETGGTAANTAAPKATAGRASSSALSKQPVVDERAEINMSERRASTGRAAASIGQQDAASSAYAGAAARTALEVAPSPEGRAVAMDLAGEPELKVVGNPRRIGAKVTLYEVAPGDTVTLTEPIPLALSQVVVTGAAAPMQRAKERTVAPQAAARPDAAVAAAPDSPRVALQSAPAPARMLSAPAPVRQVEVANGVTTITWADATTGNVLKLSGRMPEARLQQIKIRIERERAPAAKKTP
jgi:anti-sigma factor RsiW